MQNNDIATFIRLLTTAFATYGQPAPEEDVARLWISILGPYDIEEIKSAFLRHIQNPDTGQFAPKPADIIRIIAGTSKNRAEAAWSKVDKAIRQVGTYSDIAFDDAIIHRVVHDMGGWVWLGGIGDDEWPFVRNDFVSRYSGYAARQDAFEYPGVLAGIASSHNSRHGFAVKPPMLYGDAKTARQVMTHGLEGYELTTITPLDALEKRLALGVDDKGGGDEQAQ